MLLMDNSMEPVLLTTGRTEYFKGIGRIACEGPHSDNPLTYHWYDPNRVVAGKPMAEHLRFAVAWWHTLGGTGADPFGMPTRRYPWLESTDPLQLAKDKLDAGFELITKLGIPFYCFHDYDLIAEGETLKESRRRLDAIAEYALEKQAVSGVRVLWGTANLFSHPRYMNGALTNPDFQVVAWAAGQVRNALDLTMRLGGQGYVFWGGRDGYQSLLNTDMKREREHIARFLHLAKDYARSIGFEGAFFIEPKPMEPCKHQYDFDAATCLNFLREFDLMGDFKLNVEVNHATLAQHSFQHELQVAADAGMLGSIDANRGDYQNGWDTDQFPVNVPELTEAMLVILEAGGLKGGGINFDAKLRRNSTDLEDLFVAHIGGMDAFARALLAADAVLRGSNYRALRRQRYASFGEGAGRDFERGLLSLTDLAVLAENSDEPEVRSGKQELFERILNGAL